MISNVSAGYNKCSDIYSSETGEIVYKLNAVLLQSNKKDTVDFADDYYRVIKHSEYGGEGTFSVEGMKVYSYDGEEIASSSYDSKNGGGSLDTSAYPCNNRQIRIDFEKVDTDSAEYWVSGENLLAKYPYTYKEYGNSQAVHLNRFCVIFYSDKIYTYDLKDRCLCLSRAYRTEHR